MFVRLAGGAALFAIFALAFVAGVLLHLDLAVSRRFVAREVNARLAGLSSGKIELAGLERLTPSRIAVRSVDVELVGTGHVRLQEVRVRFDVVRTLEAFVRGRGALAIHLPSVDVALADVTLVPGPKPAPRAERTRSTELRIDVDELRLAHGYVHGRMPDGFVVDGDVDGLRASVSIDGKRARGNGAAAVTARSILPEPVRVDVDGVASLPLDETGPRSASVGLSATAGDVRVAAQGELRGDTVELEISVPETSSEAVRELWEASPLTESVSLRGHASGTLPRLDVRADATLGPGRALVEGSLDLDGGPSAQLTLKARDVDLRALGRSLPASRVGFDAEGTLRRVAASKGELPLRGAVTVSTVRSSIAGEALPHVEAEAHVDRVLRVTAVVDEPGAPTRVEVTQTGPRSLRASLESTAPSLARVSRLARHGIRATGRGVLRAEASLDGEVMASRATLDVYRVDLSKVAIGAGRFEARAEGPLRAPRIWASGHVIALRREPYAVNDLVANVSGDLDAFEIALAGRGGSLDALSLDARVERSERTSVRDASARLERGGEEVTIAAREIAIAPDLLQVDGLTIAGIGDPVEASASRSRGRVVAQVRAPALDLDRLAVILGVDPERLGGKGSMSVSLDLGHDRESAEAAIRLTEARLGPVPVVDAALDFALEGRSVHGLFSVRNPELGGAHLEATGVVGGMLLDPKSIAASRGRVQFTSDRLSIPRLCAVLPCPDSFRRAATSGRATLQAHAVVERADAEADGDTRLHLDAQANDTVGSVGHLSLDSRVDLATLLSTRRLPTDAPLEADFAIDPRALEDLPPNWRPAALSGRVEVHGYAQGTIGQPFFVVEAAGHSLRYEAGLRNAPELDVEWVTTYDLEEAGSEITVRSEGRDAVRASVQAKASLERLLAGDDRAWTGGAWVEVDRFPLDFLPTDEQRVAGDLSGRISISGLHDKPRAQARLTADEVHVGRDSAGPVALSLELDERSCVASLDAGGADAPPDAGRATLRASAGCVWKNGLVPSIDPNAPIEVALDAARFPLGTVAPAVDAWVERLRGRLDAHLRATAVPRGDARTWLTAGEIHLREGNLLPLAIGREIRQLQLDLQATQGGGIRVENIAGEIGGGRFTGVASVAVENTTLQGGHAELHVPRRQAIPITLEGVSYGTVWGDVTVDAELRSTELLVVVRAPTLRAELPPQRTAQLEPLKDDPAIFVLQPLGPPQRTQAIGGGPGAPRPRSIVFSLELGNNVGISREDMKVELSTLEPPGNPKLILDPEPRLEGAIRILGGRVPVAGRVFRIERGIVRFGGDDPANPALDVDAVYESSDTSGTRIHVHVGGTAKDVKLSLTSSPPKPESELLAILAFGEPSPSSGVGGTPPTGGTAAATSAAAGVGSAILTSGVNQLLSQSIIPIRTSVSTGASTLASASVELTERVRVQYIRLFGATLYGQTQDVNQFALDWRFRPRWLLRTVVGDRGTTTLDVLWNRWY
jgi:autotransporter translocation and assembly factor TamB